MVEIKKPKVKTWYIHNCKTPEAGFVETNQVYTCGGGDEKELETFTDEVKWLARIKELNINIENI